MAGKSIKSDNRGSSLFGFNVSGKTREYHTFESASRALPPGIEATGGLTTSITDGSKNYKVHTFLATGVFEVTSTGPLSSEIEYLVVAGGGSGGQNLAGGGGAGGLRTNLSGHPLAADPYTVGIGTYQVTVGAGGASVSTNNAKGNPGNDSEFYPPAASYPNAAFIRAVKGGGGSGGPGGATHVSNAAGGSGGGAPGYGYPPGVGGSGNPADPNHPKIQGYPGGSNVGNPTSGGWGNNYIGGGGGGAAGAGVRGDAPNEGGDDPLTGNGGAGVQVNIDGNNYYYAGGGGAAAYTATTQNGSRDAGDGGIGGGGGGQSNFVPDGSGGQSHPTKGIGGGSARNSGGDGSPSPTSGSGTGGNGGENTGGGGGGCGHNVGPSSGAGGKGIVIIRYQVP